MSIKSIIGVYDYETDKSMKDPVAPNSYQLQGNVYDQWVKANDPAYTLALMELKTKIQHVSYKAFQEALKDTVSQLQSKISAENVKYVALVQPGKSQKWVTEIAMQMGLKASAYVHLGEEGANGLAYALQNIKPKDNRFKHYVIADDGSFSGNQMANNISAAHKILKEKFAVEPVFHILIPYITKTAEDKISGLSEKNIKVHLYKSKEMPLIKNAISQKNLQKVLDILWSKTEKNRQLELASSTALYWFDHKIPNSMSFPDVLAKGTVTQPKVNKGNQTIAFLPDVQPPYKPHGV